MCTQVIKEEFFLFKLAKVHLNDFSTGVPSSEWTFCLSINESPMQGLFNACTCCCLVFCTIQRQIDDYIQVSSLSLSKLIMLVA